MCKLTLDIKNDKIFLLFFFYLIFFIIINIFIIDVIIITFISSSIAVV